VLPTVHYNMGGDPTNFKGQVTWLLACKWNDSWNNFLFTPRLLRTKMELMLFYLVCALLEKLPAHPCTVLTAWVLILCSIWSFSAEHVP
jgi:hypothetical protein